MSEENWDPKKDDCRRQGPQRPGREDHFRAEAPGGWKLDIMGPGVQGIQLAILVVIAYWVIAVIGPILLRFADNERQRILVSAVAICTNTERDVAKIKERYDWCRREHGLEVR